MNKIAHNSLGMKAYTPTSIKSVEKEYNLKIKSANKNMKLSTYIERSGLPQMAKLLRIVEKQADSEENKKK